MTPDIRLLFDRYKSKLLSLERRVAKLETMLQNQQDKKADLSDDKYDQE